VVLSQSPGIVLADQVPDQVYFRSDIIVRSGRREFPKIIISVAPSYLATSRGGKISCENCELAMIYRVKRMGLVRIMRDVVTLTSGYPVC